MEKKLPLYRIVVDKEDESGVFAISMVDEPAIERDFIKLSKQEKIEIKFSANKDKQLLYGPLLIPNKQIYRRTEGGEEFNIVFEQETIDLIAEKYNKNKLGDIFNFQHSDQMVEAFLKENWVTGKKDKSHDYGFDDLPEGTWFGVVKVENEEFWNKYVKSGEVKGFSVEIAADIELFELTSQINNKSDKKEEMEKTKLGMVKREDGVEIYYDGETVEVGTPLFLNPEMTEVAPEGEHTLEDGTKVVLDAEGKITEIITPQVEEEVEEEMSEETTEELSEEETETITEELSFEEKVMSIVQPLIDSVITQNSELLNKITEMEANITKSKEEEFTELKSQVEKLSKMAGDVSITKKSDDRKIKVENELSERINIFRKFR